MALEFPTSPTNNQVYDNYIYSTATGAWKKLPGNAFSFADIDDTPPSAPNAGDLWWNSNEGQMYIYYNDGTSSQWVPTASPSVAVQDTAPAGYDGQLWLDSTDGSMYVYYTDPGGANAQWIGAVSRSGGILQVVSTTKTDVFTTPSSTLVDVTGLSATITPTSASSKIHVIVSLALNHTTSAYGAFGAVLRGSTIIGAGTPEGSRPAGSFYVRRNDSSAANSTGTQIFSHLDSPNTTSSTTYKVQVAIESGSLATVNRGPANDNNSANFPRLASSITLMEVAQ